MAAVVSMGQTAQYTPCSNLIQELHTCAPSFGVQESKFWARWEKGDVEKKKREFKKEKGESLFPEKRNPWDVRNTLTN